MVQSLQGGESYSQWPLQGLRRWLPLLLLLVVIHPPQGAVGLQPLQCAFQARLFTLYGELGEALEHFNGLYGSYTHGRPKVIAEHVKLFQLHVLAQDLFEVLDAFRSLACLSLCPEACSDLSNGIRLEDKITEVQLVEKLNNLKLDAELVGDDPGYSFMDGSQHFLREAKQHAVAVIAAASQGTGGDVDWDEALSTCVAKIVSRVMFPLMKVVALSAKENESHTILHGVSLDGENPASQSVSYINPRCPSFLIGNDATSATNCDAEFSFEFLRSLATTGRSLQPYVAPTSGPAAMCSPNSSPHLKKGVSFRWPRRWRLQMETVEATPRVAQMLENLEGGVLELSHVYLALRPFGNGGWAQNISCRGSGLDYDPTLCLQSQGWGGHIYTVNVHPPYRVELRIVGRGLGDSAQAGHSTFMDVLRPYPYQNENEMPTHSLEHLLTRVDFIWRQTNEPSPDVFFLHPSVHNCHAVEYLFTGAPLKPKILVIPINPLVPPPFEVLPRFEAWWHRLRPALASSWLASEWVSADHSDGNGDGDDGTAKAATGSKGMMDDYVQPSFWLAQCSLATVEAMLRNMAKRKFTYSLHHVDQAFAVYVRKDLQQALTPPEDIGITESLLNHWLQGWFCVPESRFFARLELVAGPLATKLADPEVFDDEKEKLLCQLIRRHRIPLQNSSLDCGDAAAAEGEHSCIRPDVRGWGNEAVVQDSVQHSAFDCEVQCSLTNCSYWTFDPTATYGQPLCWVWIGGRPEEIKVESGWRSGDADCFHGQALKQGILGQSSTRESKAENESSTNSAQVEEPSEGSMSSKGPRQLSKQWAVEQLRELPGMRYFLEKGNRGRCVQDFCECFPPYRGPLCQHLDVGSRSTERNFTGVLHYLTSDDATDIEDIGHSLPRLWHRFNRRYDYPVVIFNDGLSEEHRRQIVHSSDNRIWFAYVDDYLDVPGMISKDPTRRAMLDEVKWSMGYRGMCRFRSGTIFLQPVMGSFQYAMTLDTDGYFPASLEHDPIAAMHAGNYVYTFSHLLPDLPGAVKHFWEYSLMYMRMKDIDPRGTEILKQFVREDDLQWNYQLYMNDIEIVQLDWFRSEPYQDYFRYLDSVGGFWLHRWGDHAVRTIAVGMWLPKDRVYEMDIPYGHQNYCRCSSAWPNRTCTREGDLGGQPAKWWVCT
mmetsp:Transcript_28186/g.54329  ORF Transcript_28186/g.54329 Transcript_28186/m.54329 type:complete len:1162 (+) Transcript_28186:128-3613(+)